MIGDLIYSSADHCYCRITAIDSYDNEVAISTNDVFNIENITPIPISHNVLMDINRNLLIDNGVYYNGIEIYNLVWDDTNKDGYCHYISFRKLYDKNGEFYALGIAIGGELRVIKYVHELQHLLKLCGIEKEIEL